LKPKPGAGARGLHRRVAHDADAGTQLASAASRTSPRHRDPCELPASSPPVSSQLKAASFSLVHNLHCLPGLRAVILCCRPSSPLPSRRGRVSHAPVAHTHTPWPRCLSTPLHEHLHGTHGRRAPRGHHGRDRAAPSSAEHPLARTMRRPAVPRPRITTSPLRPHAQHGSNLASAMLAAARSLAASSALAI
jgi:hypothetical protein